MIVIILASFVCLSLLITIYVWLSVRIRLRKIVSYDQALNFELNHIKKEHIKWNLKAYKFDKSYQTLKTRFGNVDLYKFGNSNKVVIFVHGIWSNNRSVLKILDYFISRNYSVISYDNFGWGQSRDFGITSLGTKEALLLYDVVDDIKKQLNPQELILYGESMGGGTVYNFLGLFNNHIIDKAIINAGYVSFFDNIIKLGKKQLWYLIYLAYFPLMFVFWCQKWPIKPFVKKHQLEKMSNVYHIHSIKDKLVTYSHIKKYLPYIKHHIYENPQIPHVLGWYYATQEHYNLLDQWLKEKNHL